MTHIRNANSVGLCRHQAKAQKVQAHGRPPAAGNLDDSQ